MIIESISLKNFRQYLDETIIFAQSSTRNVTVIHGENGSGKTALLHAFIWCLYGDLNLPNPENIINDHVISSLNKGEKVEVYVKLEFRNNSYKYILKRTIAAEKIDENNMHYHEPVVDLKYKNEEGQLKPINNPTEEINQIIPNDLRTYFFFDGERIDNLSKEEGSKDIRDAIKNMMGLEILERSINHTDEARKRFRTDLKNFGDPETQKIISEMEDLEKEKTDLEYRRKEHRRNLDSTDNQIKTVEERLTQIEEAKFLQQQRDDKTEQLNKAKEVKEQLTKQLQSHMSKYGHLAFTTKLLITADNVVQSLSNDGKITGINEHFIEDLLKNNKCICGESFGEGSTQEQHLLHLKTLITSNKIDGEIEQFNKETIRVEERRKNLFKEIRDIRKKEHDKLIEIRKLKEEIQEISTSLSDKNSEEIVNLENKRRKLIGQKSETDQKVGALNEKISELDNKIKDKEVEQEKHKKIESQSLLAEKRMITCEQLIIAMKKILSIREKNVKQQLQQRITKVYTQFLRKNYQIELSDAYELNVVNENGNIVAMSQGERQITSLSFIGAIVDIARETYNNEAKTEFDEGGIYPIIMDSPFGALDSDHRERVAKGITKLADQIVVIVSTSQWQGEVSEQLKESIGKEYTLEYNDPRYNKDEPYEFTRVLEAQ